MASVEVDVDAEMPIRDSPDCSPPALAVAVGAADALFLALLRVEDELVDANTAS